MAGASQEYTSIEICAGAGGQAIGLEQAGFAHRALIEFDKHACATLRRNVELQKWGEPDRLVLEKDLTQYGGPELISDGYVEPGELSLLAGGVPCPPFSFAGKQLGREDERDLFPKMLNMVKALRPRAVMIENVRGLLEPPEKFSEYREWIESKLRGLGYTVVGWDVLEARDFGVPQLRPRAILVAMKKKEALRFPKIKRSDFPLRTVAEALQPSMLERFEAYGDLEHYHRWQKKALENDNVAPTLVGGSKKHGGADLGPSRAKKAWADFGVDANGVANDPEEMVSPERDLLGEVGPKLTVQQAALIQGFPEDWEFVGRKTARYRQVGNAFPPPVAAVVGRAIFDALKSVDDDPDADPVEPFKRGLLAPEPDGAEVPEAPEPAPVQLPLPEQAPVIAPAS